MWDKAEGVEEPSSFASVWKVEWELWVFQGSCDVSFKMQKGFPSEPWWNWQGDFFFSSLVSFEKLARWCATVVNWFSCGSLVIDSGCMECPLEAVCLVCFSSWHSLQNIVQSLVLVLLWFTYGSFIDVEIFTALFRWICSRLCVYDDFVNVIVYVSNTFAISSLLSVRGCNKDYMR